MDCYREQRTKQKKKVIAALIRKAVEQPGVLRGRGKARGKGETQKKGNSSYSRSSSAVLKEIKRNVRICRNICIA